ncbi:MAG TPA: hypothetical protein VNN73_02010 [Blastocatellia bacterium]|nr:hypothetical protein [Blastocatellia bacterium]
MKRILAITVLGLFLIGSAFAGITFKYTFPDVMYPDGQKGTIQAAVKQNKNGTVTTCSYFSDPNNQYLGQFQGTDNTSTDAVVVRDYCLSHYADRTP